MKVAALSSGSAGNCFYLENENSALLIDAGINAKRIHERMNSLRIDNSKIKGLFLTHEHIDHIRGADVLARQLNIPIFATKGTVKNGFICSNPSLISEIKNNEIIKLAGFSIEAFSKSHKAADPVSFSITHKDKTVSVITDLGYSCDNANSAIEKSDFLFLESNHDPEMLQNGPYPYFLKNWIKGNSGHLSNNQAGLAVMEYGNSRLKNVVLSHLSNVNNSPDVAVKTFSSLMKERKNVHARVSASLENSPTQLFKVI